MGNLLYQQSDFERAIREYETAVRLESDMRDAWNNLGAVFLEVGQSVEAIARLERAVQLNPASAVAHFNLADALAQSDRLPEACIEGRRAVELARSSKSPALLAQIENKLSSGQSAAESRIQPDASSHQ